MVRRGLFGGGLMQAGLPGAQRLMSGARPDEDEQRPRGILGGRLNQIGQAFSQDSLAQTNPAGVTRGEQLGAMLMSLGGPQQQAQAMQMLGGARERGREDRLIEREREQRRQMLEGQARLLGMNPAEFMRLPEATREELFARQYTPEEPDHPNSYDEYRRTTDNPTPQGYQAFLQANPRGTRVTIDTGDNGQPLDPFQQILAGAEGEQFVGFLERGPAAQRNLMRIDRLEELLGESGSGFGAAARIAAADFGIEIGEGVGDLQAARALINNIIPDQRPPGSGEISDADILLFKQGVPRLINTPEGNRLIIETMRGINQYDAQLAQIAQAAASGQINRQQAREAVNALNNPIDSVRAFLQNGEQGRDQPGAQTQEASELPDASRLPDGATAIDNETGQRLVVRNGQWVPQ